MVHSSIPWSKSWRKVGQGGSEGCLDLLCSPRREQAEATNSRSAVEEKYEMRVVRSTRVGFLRGQAVQASLILQWPSAGRARAASSTLRMAQLPSYTAQSLSRV